MANENDGGGKGAGGQAAAPAPALADLRREGAAWVRRLLSGSATQADAAALAAWRARSGEHEAAYRDALRMLRAVEAAAPRYRERAGAAQPSRAVIVPLRSVDRRWLIGGGVAASVAGVLLVRGMMQAAPQAEFRTGVGERRRLALGSGLDVEMNTRTSLSVAQDAHGRRIDLFAGQAVVSASRLPAAMPVEVVAGQGATVAHQARFDVRNLGAGGVCVTCLEGEVSVRQAGAEARLTASQQITYGRTGLGAALHVDPAIVAAWQNGMLIFRNRPLQEVIVEVNRYRAGRIVIANAALGHRPVDAVFYLDQMNDVVAQVQQLSGARAVRLPGGIVLLS